MTDSKKPRLLPDRKYFFVLLATKHCQLKFEDLLVYSFLVYRAGTRHPAVAQRRIADNVGLCRTTIRRSVGTLGKRSLVQKTNDGRCCALDPKDKSDWFVPIKSVNTANWEWHKRFANFKLHVCRPRRMTTDSAHGASSDPAVQLLPSSDETTGPVEVQSRLRYLTPRENAVLWKLHSWNTGRVLMTVTQQGLATQLCLNREAVCRAIKQLKAKGLADDDLQVIVKDGDRDYWLEAPMTLRRNPKAEASKSLAELVLGWFKPGGGQLAYFQSSAKLRERLDGFEKTMRDEGYNGADIRHYWETVAFTLCKGNRRYVECFMLKGFPMTFRAVAEIHGLKGAGYRNSLGLLKKTEGVVRSIQKRFERRQFVDYDPLLDWEPDFGAIRFGMSRDGDDRNG